MIYLCIKLESSLTSLQQPFSLLDVANSHTATVCPIWTIEVALQQVTEVFGH
jgi:hypothetical protein